MKLVSTTLVVQHSANVILSKGKDAVTIEESEFRQYASMDPTSLGGPFIAFEGVDAATGESLDVIVHKRGLRVTRSDAVPQVVFAISRRTMEKAAVEIQTQISKKAPVSISIA